MGEKQRHFIFQLVLQENVATQLARFLLPVHNNNKIIMIIIIIIIIIIMIIITLIIIHCLLGAN